MLLLVDIQMVGNTKAACSTKVLPTSIANQLITSIQPVDVKLQLIHNNGANYIAANHHLITKASAIHEKIQGSKHFATAAAVDGHHAFAVAR